MVLVYRAVGELIRGSIAVNSSGRTLTNRWRVTLSHCQVVQVTFEVVIKANKEKLKENLREKTKSSSACSVLRFWIGS